MENITYVYSTRQLPQSSVAYTSWLKRFRIDPVRERLSWTDPPQPSKELYLVPYFEDDKYFGERLGDSPEKDIERLRDEVRIEGFGAEWDENTWTDRLACGLKLLYEPHYEVCNTTLMATEFSTKVMKTLSLPFS